ncbi:MAG: DNA topoisomerase IV subunit A [Bacilli bacterium]|nr:DNA topoisomerase IV subunit A [Bacilli bacterium]
MEDITKKIYDYSLEEIMGERFGSYSKYIIQDRAIPDVRDGLKPVQRRILYAMSKDNNTFDKKFKKCANAVGIVLGKYHPHGDTSVYDALVRLSQDWKQNHILVEVDGNNGSIDGDPPAAYRYTECRLAKISEELLGDVDKFEAMKINFAPNFDDTRLEPTVLPSRFPNLLVNGCTGISAGYATNMPPHNLGEIIDATIKRIDSPNCTLDTILNIVKGPDFPTGGIIEGLDGLRKAYETGRGKINVLCKYEFVKEKGKDKIVIDEIPFEVNKKMLILKIVEIRIDKKVDGIQEVRDESDKDSNLRIVIDLKAGANKELVMNYLLKYTDLQASYNFNNVTIVNRRPRLLGIIPIIDAYIAHQREIVKKSSEWDLAFAKKQYHITEGLVKAISILDEVIRVIRGSKNKSDAIANLVKEFEFTEEQATAIVMLQLYRLTNTDIVTLEEKLKELMAEIERLEGILSDQSKLDGEIKTTLRKIKKEYATPRRTVVKDTVTEIKINAEELVSNERVMVVLTIDGYLKRVSLKSYSSSSETTGLKPGDAPLNIFEASTLDKIMIATDMGNYLYLPVYDIPEAKWKEMGKHISNIVTVNPDEKVVSSFIVNSSTQDENIIFVTKDGMVKKTRLGAYNVTRFNKEMVAIKLKDKDSVKAVNFENNDFIIVTENGYSLRFDTADIPASGVKTSGVKGISLKDGDQVISGYSISQGDEYLTIFTDNKTAKRIKLEELEKSSRAKRGTTVLKKVKSTSYKVKDVLLSNSKTTFNLKYSDEVKSIKASEIPIMDLSSTGSSISKTAISSVQVEPVVVSISEGVPVEAKEIEDKNDDFLEDFKL